MSQNPKPFQLLCVVMRKKNLNVPCWLGFSSIYLEEKNSIFWMTLFCEWAFHNWAQPIICGLWQLSIQGKVCLLLTATQVQILLGFPNCNPSEAAYIYTYTHVLVLSSPLALSSPQFSTEGFDCRGINTFSRCFSVYAWEKSDDVVIVLSPKCRQSKTVTT